MRRKPHTTADWRCYARGCRLPECQEAWRRYMAQQRAEHPEWDQRSNDRRRTEDREYASRPEVSEYNRLRMSARQRAERRLTKRYPGVFARLLAEEMRDVPGISEIAARMRAEEEETS